MIRKFSVYLVALAAGGVQAETGYEAWLRYAPLEVAASRQYREVVPAVVTALGDSALVNNARQELIRGIRGMLGRTLRAEAQLPGEGAIVLGTLAEVRRAAPRFALTGTVQPEGYWLKAVSIDGMRYLIVTGEDERGVLYGSFALLRKIGIGESIAELDEKQAPSAPVRWLNLWDSLGGPGQRVSSAPLEGRLAPAPSCLRMAAFGMT